MKSYLQLSKQELLIEYKRVKNIYETLKGQNLSLNMARGKPSKEQLDLSKEMLTILDKTTDFQMDNQDIRNYGVLDGLKCTRDLFAQMMNVSSDQIIIGGNSSLNMMYDQIMRSFVFGIDGQTPWSQLKKVKWLCPVPGYDRHFKMCENFNIELIPIDMTNFGPDMDQVETYIQDESVKGIWCVPKYSNPTGVVYSDEVVTRLGKLQPKAKDFRIYYDNAYCEHDLYDEKRELLNIFEIAKKYDNEDIIYMFASTSKITFPGSGIAAMATSLKNKKEILLRMTHQTIGYDKLNQYRHVLFLKNLEHLQQHMQKHAQIIRPKFETVLDILEAELKELNIASWTHPRGGYFISFNGYKNTAKNIVNKAKEAGVILTDAGATYPYGIDKDDTNIRIAPTMPTRDEIKQAMQLFTICVRLATLEELMKD